MIDWALESDLARTLRAAQQTRARIARFVRATPLLELEPATAGERADGQWTVTVRAAPTAQHVELLARALTVYGHVPAS